MAMSLCLGCPRVLDSSKKFNMYSVLMSGMSQSPESQIVPKAMGAQVHEPNSNVLVWLHII